MLEISKVTISENMKTSCSPGDCSPSSPRCGPERECRPDGYCPPADVFGSKSKTSYCDPYRPPCHPEIGNPPCRPNDGGFELS